MTQSSLWRHQALISDPCDQHLPDSHKSMHYALLHLTIEDPSNFLHSVTLCNIAMRCGDHAPFLETYGFRDTWQVCVIVMQYPLPGYCVA